MKIGQRIEFATGRAESGIGTVTAYNAETEIVHVRDDEDGSTWSGSVDHTTTFED